ncbi:hypothetical protein PR048_027929 [Dryococelus australis]|uniref:Reverse transcriptase domain-containing protein n=1 Tax=Dryococelus australis TaxID=614101 RepID=A0ABQ9GHX9_9NEOP|nr:hypothetical protein PR048_027929 [Dryococelus australis]
MLRYGNNEGPVMSTQLEALETAIYKATGRESKEDAVKKKLHCYMSLGKRRKICSSQWISWKKRVKKYDSLVKYLESHFLPHTNQSMERHKFNNHVQEDGESIDTFVTALKCLSINCDYESLRDDLIKDRIPTLTVCKTVQICKTAEQTHELMQAINRKEAVGLHVVHRSNRREGNTLGTSAGDREEYEYGTSHCKVRGNHKGRRVHNTNKALSNKCGLPEQAVHHQQQKQKKHSRSLTRRKTATQGTVIQQISRVTDVDVKMQIISVLHLMLCVTTATNRGIIQEYRILFSLHDQLKEELDRMIELGLIAKVSESTEWFNPIIVVRKPTGELQDIEGVQIYIDDIIVFGKDEIEHDRRLESVLQRVTDSNVIFNLDECSFRIKEVKYIGHIVGKEGIKIDPGKVRAITEFPEPANVGNLQRFLGITTYVGKVIPNVSDNTAVLRALCKQGVIWQWTQQHTIAFEHLKTLLTTTPVAQDIATNLMKKSPEIQIATFMSVIGPDAADIYAHFAPKTSITYERGKKCEFQEQTNRLLCDKILVGIASDSVCELLLAEEKITFDQAVKINLQSCGVNQTPTSNHEDRNITNGRVHSHGKIWQRKALERDNRKGTVIIFTFECSRCGGSHQRRSFTTLMDTTLQPEKGQHAHNVEEAEEVILVSCLSSAETEFDWVETLTLPPNHKVNFKLDMGTQCNVITTSTANKCKLKIISSKARSLMSFSKDLVPVHGEVHLPVVTNSKREAVVKFFIVENGHQCVLGRKTCESLEFIRRLETVDTNDKLFDGIGCLKGFVYDIDLVDQPNLKVHPPCRVPYPIRNKVKEEIDSMVKSNIIAPITEPTTAV